MKTLTATDFREFFSVLRRAWSLETSPQWLPHDPARGQGPVTALVFHDRFGGEILKTPVGDDWHFYNRVSGRVCDFAAEQFSELPAYLNIPSSRWSAPRFDCSPWGRKMRREVPWASTDGRPTGDGCSARSSSGRRSSES